MSEAEDIVQTTIIKLWNNIEQLNKIDNIENYLYRCVKNACLNFLRNNKSRINHISEIDIALLEIANEQINDTDEKYEQIEKAIEALPLQCKQILELNRFEGLSYKEIATKLNISHRTVDSHLCNAMKQIRKKLNPTLTCSIIFLISMLKQL
jgi:RNA polymerase sigma-70 factor, ECF subfamily